MGILSWLLFGLIIGIIAKWLVPGGGPGGIVGDIVVGIVGSMIGGFVYGFFGNIGVTGFNLGSVICAVIGAVIFLAILRSFTGRARQT
ncbi:MAG TPA: GlsB/YeaQ/YmgE family stress response membrane protein [Candidatus Baltobacteraceae bacterium]|jgi:uncharacterized membrane protein YeaQ/YmgE (transglycosylase-associated protein family)|nr:GlsB/YeaQ/YmgE family stress response membrane protein [Candidatus Baltobacteraceae bacterium]